MKKSEMIQYIVNSMIISSGDDSNINLDLHKFVKNVLDISEDLGMLPPLTKLSHLEGYDNGWDVE